VTVKKAIACICVFLTNLGEEDDTELKIDSIIEGCNGTWLRNQGRMCQYLEGQCLRPSVKSKRLTEAVLTLQSPCEARHVLINTYFNIVGRKISCFKGAINNLYIYN
jgi:hypothetical protein